VFARRQHEYRDYAEKLSGTICGFTWHVRERLKNVGNHRRERSGTPMEPAGQQVRDKVGV